MTSKVDASVPWYETQKGARKGGVIFAALTVILLLGAAATATAFSKQFLDKRTLAVALGSSLGGLGCITLVGAIYLLTKKYFDKDSDFHLSRTEQFMESLGTKSWHEARAEMMQGTNKEFEPTADAITPFLSGQMNQAESFAAFITKLGSWEPLDKGYLDLPTVKQKLEEDLARANGNIHQFLEPYWLTSNNSLLRGKWYRLFQRGLLDDDTKNHLAFEKADLSFSDYVHCYGPKIWCYAGEANQKRAQDKQTEEEKQKRQELLSRK